MSLQSLYSSNKNDYIKLGSFSSPVLSQSTNQLQKYYTRQDKIIDCTDFENAWNTIKTYIVMGTCLILQLIVAKEKENDVVLIGMRINGESYGFFINNLSVSPAPNVFEIYYNIMRHNSNVDGGPTYFCLCAHNTNYYIVETQTSEIGKGGYGTVMLGYAGLDLNTEVAIKIMEVKNDGVVLQEIGNLNKIKPHCGTKYICNIDAFVIDVQNQMGTRGMDIDDMGKIYNCTSDVFAYFGRVRSAKMTDCWIVTQYYGRVDWQNFVDSGIANGITHTTFVATFKKMFDNLVGLHKLNIIHRDIKPQNILITHPQTYPDPILIDFGTSCQINDKLYECMQSGFTPGFTYPPFVLVQLKTRFQLPLVAMGKIGDIWSIFVMLLDFFSNNKSVLLLIPNTVRFNSNKDNSDAWGVFIARFAYLMIKHGDELLQYFTAKISEIMHQDDIKERIINIYTIFIQIAKKFSKLFHCNEFTIPKNKHIVKSDKVVALLIWNDTDCVAQTHVEFTQTELSEFDDKYDELIGGFRELFGIIN